MVLVIGVTIVESLGRLIIKEQERVRELTVEDMLMYEQELEHKT